MRSTLGRGTSSVVYRAFDRQHGGEVALKVLSAQAPAGLLAFKREFRSMADVSHPNLVKLYELHAVGEGLMFTMELVDGTDFLGYVRRPVGASPVWEDGEARPPAPERDTVAEWAGPAPERVPFGVAGELSYFPPLSSGQLPTLRTITAQLVRGLMALHDAGHVHRDVKPSNVMVDDSGRAVLLDFGVAAELAGPAQTAGTPAYMSPEQARGVPPSPSADFYAVGVMLYEALTGELPHAGDDPVRDKLVRDPDPPSALVEGVPVDLDRLCLALMARDPEVRPTGPAILDLLCGDTERTLPTRQDIRSEVPRLGREAELARLEAAMKRVGGGEGQLVLITGRSGIGKSALMRHFVAGQRRKGAVVLTGRCYEQESVSYKALDAVMDALCHHLASLPPEEREELMPRHRWALGQLFPVLAQFESPPLEVPMTGSGLRAGDDLMEVRQRQTVRVTGRSTREAEPLQVRTQRTTVTIDLPAEFRSHQTTKPDVVPASPEVRQRRAEPSIFSQSTVVVGAPTGPQPSLQMATDPARVRRQGVAALRQLLESLARHSPFIIAIDDLQWGDVDSAQVLTEVLSPPLPSLLLVGTFRREDAETSAFLRTFGAVQPGAETLSLDALTPAAALELAQTLVDDPTGAGAGEVAEEAKGDPFLLVELARYVSDKAEPRLPARGLSVEAVVRARIRQIDVPARRMLEVLAVAGGPIARPVARRAADVGPQESAAMVQLRASNLLRVKGTRGVEVIETYHDRIREAVREQIGEDERRGLHLRLVDALIAEGYADHERLGKHLEQGGRLEEAVPHYRRAAQIAARALAFDRASALYRRTLAAGLLGRDDEMDVRSDFAEVLMRQGRFDEAADELSRVRVRLEPGQRRANVFHKLGEVELGRGDIAAAATALEHALSDLGHPVPRTRRALWLGSLREIAVQLRHTYFPRPDAPQPATPGERLAMQIYSRLTYAYYFSRGGLEVFWPHLRELNAAERHPPTRELGHAYSGHGMMLSALPWFRRGLTYVRRSLEIQRELGERWGEAQALHQQGVVLYGASRFAEAARVSMVAAERLEAVGDVAEGHNALLHAALAMYRLGRTVAATRIARRIHEEALDTGDVFAAATSVLVWACASGGRVPALMIRVQVELSSEIAHRFIKVIAMQASGLRLLGCRRAEEAAHVLDAAAADLRSSGLLSTELVSEIDVWRATAWRRVAEAQVDPGRRRAALRRARRCLRRGLWSTARFRNGLPHALREAAHLAALGGGLRRAGRYLEASLSVARRQEQSTQVALGERLHAELIGGPRPELNAQTPAGRSLLSAYRLEHNQAP